MKTDWERQRDADKLKRQQDFHDRSFWFMLVMMVFLVATCSGCVQLTEFEKADRLAHDRDVWELCVMVYDEANIPMIRREQGASRIKQRVGSNREVGRLRNDIRMNSCRTIYKQIVKRSGR